MPKPNDIKAFSFLDLDPRAVADQLRRAGWTLDQVHVMTDLTRDWARAVVDQYCAAEESQMDGEP